MPASVCRHKGAQTTATCDRSNAPSSGSTHVEPAGPASPRRHSPELGYGWQFPRSPTALPLITVHPRLSPMSGFGSPLVLRPHTRPFPDKAGGLSAPEPRGGPDTAEQTSAESASRRGAWVLSPPLACPQGAGRGLWGPNVWCRDPTRRSSGADTRPRWRCRMEAPRHRFIHTHVPLVCAPPACRRYPAGATEISGRPHPPRPQRCSPGIRSLLGVSATASKTWRRHREPGCSASLRAATQRPHLPPLPRPRPAFTFSCRRWGSVTAPGQFSRRPPPPGGCSRRAFLRCQPPS